MKRRHKESEEAKKKKKGQKRKRNTLDELVSENMRVFQIGAVELEGFNTLHEYSLKM